VFVTNDVPSRASDVFPEAPRAVIQLALTDGCRGSGANGTRRAPRKDFVVSGAGQHDPRAGSGCRGIARCVLDGG
jgi:hypothetical protein